MWVPKRSALEASRRQLSEGISFGTGTLLVVEQSSLENLPEGRDVHGRKGTFCFALTVPCLQLRYLALTYFTLP